MRSEREVEAAIERYADTVRRICMVHLRREADTEDIFQTVFLRYAMHTGRFESPAHERAWLIRVTLNACSDLRRSFFRSRTSPIETLEALPDETAPQNREVLEAVLSLPERYREVIYLHYYEGYTAPEIGRILRKNPNTIYTWLARAKKQLAAMLKEG